MKRTMDVLGSGLGLVLLSPLFAIVAVMIKLDSRGPVFFRQLRMGKDFVPFHILKFRSMVDGAEQGGPLTLRDDARVTRVGRFLRASKIDEVPQLVNVLHGEMSLVGARPEVPRYVNLYRDEFALILRVRPGITDVAALHFRDESKLLAETADAEATYVEHILPEKLRMSSDYAERASLLYDLRLVLKTILYVVYPSRTVEAALDWANPYRVWFSVLLQGAAIVAAHTLALALRFDGRVPAHEHAIFVRALPLILLIRLAWLYPLGLFHGMWRYSGIQDVQRIVAAVALGSVTSWFALPWLLGITSYSLGVFVIDAVLCVILLHGLRMVRRFHRRLHANTWPARRVLLVGAEEHMERVVAEIGLRGGGQYHVIGMLNGGTHRKGIHIRGVPVLGTQADLSGVVHATDPDEILIALPTAAASERDDLIRRCRELGKFARAVPDVGDFLLRRGTPRMAGAFQPEDLLFREPIHTDSEIAEVTIRGRAVMITGAGGSIGSEISRQAAACNPSALVLFERHEFALYEIDRELRGRYPTLAIEPVIGDVADAGRVDETMARFRPRLVFHAAAYKHVPMMELNPGEAMRTNVVGTRTVADSAARHGAEVFLLVSTDKAVEPVSMMGLSKRIAELAMQVMAPLCTTRILTVRFGNVLESSGSVVPLFREQIERGGPVTVTHPEVTRLFMTVPEAVQLILQAGAVGQGGDVLVLDMGKPVRVLDMARALIRLYGLTPGKDIRIDITGLRPGERLFEKLFNDDEAVWKSGHPKILRAVSHGDLSWKRAEMRRLIQVAGTRVGTSSREVRAVEELLTPRSDPAERSTEWVTA